MTTNKKQTAEQGLAADAATEVIAPGESSAFTVPLFTTPIATDHGNADTVIASPDATWAPPAQHETADATPAKPSAGPRTRWAAIVWGLLFAAIAAGTLLTLLSPERRDDFAVWAVSLSPTTVTLYGLLAVGALVLVGGLAGLLRRAQRRVSRA